MGYSFSGGQTTLTGDVTGSGTGSFAATIAAGAITLAKQADMATASVVYRKTAGAGAPEVNTLATLKADLGLTGTNSGDQFTAVTSSRLLGRATAGFGAAEELSLGSNVSVSGGTLNVTFSATNKLLGRATAGAGNAEEITCTAAGRALIDDADAAAQLVTLDAMQRTPQIQAVASASTVTPTFANDMVKITALAAACQLLNPTGTALGGWGIVVRIKDNGTARALTYDTQYRAIGVTLPTTTAISKTLYLGMIYNADDTKWDVVSVAQEA